MNNNYDNNKGMQSSVNDPELAKTIKTVREFSDDLDDPSHLNPDDAPPSSPPGAGTNDKTGIDTGSPAETGANNPTAAGG